MVCSVNVCHTAGFMGNVPKLRIVEYWMAVQMENVDNNPEMYNIKQTLMRKTYHVMGL